MDFDLEAINPTTGSGGILSIWDSTIFRKSESFLTRNYIATTGSWKGFPGTTTIVNVYAPQSVTEKRSLWEDLTLLKSQTPGTWIFLGDFNVVSHPKERFNSSFCKYTTSDFNKFIVVAGLYEFNQGGKKFTYLRDDGFKQSKLDKFLVCQKFIKQQPLTTVTVLPCKHSDHSLVLLKPSSLNFGPPPFRFFNSWMLHKDFDTIFDNAWKNFSSFGAPDQYFLAKLKYLKGILKNWRSDVSKLEHDDLKQLREKVDCFELEAESRILYDSGIIDRRESLFKIGELEYAVKLDMRQKAKVRWICDGDENTRFFYGMLKNKNRRNQI
ncbi:uncharacterized protein LOC111898035 [Lactuca sativa]|uniref:uncharacterized protein LOC111898035 n=1 Tax=Lactuca sativa TaxID=4236 RepID=UPI000CD98433|nr:uncharacterized protein LOC111898035 [Lactuca sativa]